MPLCPAMLTAKLLLKRTSSLQMLLLLLLLLLLWVALTNQRLAGAEQR